MRRFALLLLALFIAAETAQAQRPAGRQGPPGARIEGRVADADTGQGIGTATVALWSAADSSLVTGAITESDGAFRLESLRPGRYYLRVSFVGYVPEVVPDLALRPGAALEVGTVALRLDEALLGEVEVAAERSQVEVGLDRMVYNTAELPESSSGGATDVLRNIPSVEVDIDGNVSLRGSQNVAIHLNGKPVPVSGAFLSTFLQQLPANAIDRIEVIPNPSAKYDPEGMSGIINIVTKQNADLGLSGGFTLSGATSGSGNAAANVGYGKGPWNVYASYGLRRDDRDIDYLNYRENRLAGQIEPLSILDQRDAGERTGLSHLLNTSVDYRLGARSTVSTTAVVSLRDGGRDNENRLRLVDADGIETTSVRTTDNDAGGVNADLGLSLRRVVEASRNELSAELRYNRAVEDDANRFVERTGAAELLEADARDEIVDEGTAQLDWTYPLAGGKLEAGYKGELRRLDYTFEAERQIDGEWERDLGLSNSFLYDEQVQAVYATWGRSVGAFEAQAGLRGEIARTAFDLVTTGEQFENDYESLYPSAFVQYSLTPMRKLKASYSKRVSRPRTRMLNPFASQADRFNQFVGNPSLRPEYTHAFELSLSQIAERFTLTLSPYYRHTVDAFNRRVDVVDNVAIVTFVNFATSDSYGVEAIGTLRPNRRLNLFASFNAYRTVSDGANVDADLTNDALGWMVRGNASLQLRPGTDVQVFAFYRAPMDIAQGRLQAFSMANLSIRQKLLGDRATLALQFSDVFDTMNFRFALDDDTFYRRGERQWGARQATLTFTYTFGQPPRRAERRTGGDEGDMDMGGIN